MARNSTRMAEQHAFEQFAKCFSLPPGQIEFTDRPDVVLHGATSIGIEITRLFICSDQVELSIQRQRPRREKVVELAHRLYRQSANRRFDYSFSFDPKLPISNPAAVAKTLAAVAVEADRLAGGVVPSNVRASCPEVDWIYRTDDEFPDPGWHHVQSYSVPALQPARVQDAVDAKTLKVAGYRACDVRWLLVVVDFWDPAQDQELIWPVGAQLETRAFDRVIVFKPQFLEWIEPGGR